MHVYGTTLVSLKVGDLQNLAILNPHVHYSIPNESKLTYWSKLFVFK